MFDLDSSLSNHADIKPVYLPDFKLKFKRPSIRQVKQENIQHWEKRNWLVIGNIVLEDGERLAIMVPRKSWR